MKEDTFFNPKITKRLRELLAELGDEYSIKQIDLEWCLCRDFHDGYDVEISGANHNSTKGKVTIFLWKDKYTLVCTLPNVKQCHIGEAVEAIHAEPQKVAAWVERQTYRR